MVATLALSPIEDAIAAVLQRWLSVPFSVAQANCAIDLLDYAETLTGRTYARRPDRREALRIARDHRGVVEVAADAALALGCVPISSGIKRGDMGIIANAHHRPTASLCLRAGDDRAAPMMAARGASGVEIARIEPDHAWRVPCHKR